MHVDSVRACSRGLAFGLCFWMLFCDAARADELLDKSARLAQQGAFAQAFQLLDAQEPLRAGELLFDAAMGRAAFAAGQYTRAVLAWERVVAQQPDDTVALQELGRSLFAVGDKKGAWALSAMVREQGIPVDAAQDVDQLLFSYDRADHEGGSTAKAYAEIAVGHDSNANAGPAAATLVSSVPGNFLWTLAPGALPNSSGFGTALIAVRARHVLDPRWSLIGAASVSARRHAGDARSFDQTQFDGIAGIAWRVERQELVISGVGAAQWLDNARLRNMAGVQGEWIYRMDGFRQWSGFVQALDLHYPAQATRDVRRSVAGATYAQVVRNGALFYGSVYLGRESPDIGAKAFEGHRLVGWRLGGQYPLTRQLGVFALLERERRSYGAVDPFFAVQRRDQLSNIALGLSWVPAPDWRITPQLMWVQNDSTVPVSQYRRRVFSVTFRRAF